VVVALAATYDGTSDVDPDVVDVDVEVVYNVLRAEVDSVPVQLMITCAATMGTDSLYMLLPYPWVI
jgi:hypothetical protein